MRISKNELKTRELVEEYRKANDSGYLGEQMRAAYLKTREKIEERNQNAEESREEYAGDRVTGTMEDAGRDVVHHGHRIEQNAVQRIKQNKIQQTYRTVDRSVSVSTSYGVKTVNRSIKTVESPSTAYHLKAEMIRDAQIQKAAKQATKASEFATQSIKVSAERIKGFLAASIRTVKRVIITATQTTTALLAGSWVAMMVVVVVLMVGMIAGSSFGIFFTGEEFGDGFLMKDVIREINDEYQSALDHLVNTIPHDEIEMSGSRARWPEVLSVYAVKVTTDPDRAQEVATIDEEKKSILEDVFWQMNNITYEVVLRTEMEVIETSDDAGNIIETWTEVEKEYLVITVEHKSAEEMAALLGFNTKQQDEVQQLIDEEHGSLWVSVLYGIDAGEDAIVQVAASQIGNVGGRLYWSWYGFTSRVEWCACFVSWCANELGYIDAGVIPRFAGCEHGVYWFKQRDQWLDGSEEPMPGMIIFFDWASNGLTGTSDHVGIIARVEDNRVYTIEGNTSDRCLERSYPLGDSEILGYGVPQY